MSTDYTAWPTATNVLGLAETVQGIDLSSVSDDVVDRIISAVARSIVQKTKRQFVVDRDDEGDAVETTRYFDGSGTGEQRVDEYVSISAVGLMSFSGASPATVENYYTPSDNNFPHTRIQIFHGGPPGWGAGYYTTFPEGRGNLSVTGVWGYAEEIPADLWQAHCEECAGRIAALTIATVDGRTKSYTVGNALTESFDLTLPGDTAGWHDSATGVICSYVNPNVHSPTILKPRMI